MRKGILKKALSLMLALAMIVALPVGSDYVYAAEENGLTEDAAVSLSQAKTGTAIVTMMHENKDQLSMCDPMFAANAELTAENGNATIKFFVANPVPGFPDQGADGTVKDVKVTYNETQYVATSEVGTDAKMTAKADNALFGLTAGQEYNAQVLTVTLPEAAVTEGALLQVDCYVNVVMNSNQVFRMNLTNVTWNESKPEPQPEPPVMEAKKGTAKVTMMHESKDQPSMCNDMFGENVDIKIKDGKATLTLLVANPVPGFPDQGADGTVKNVKVTYDGQQYDALSDIKTKPMMTAKADNSLFGLTAGQEYSAQVLTVTLPEAAVTEGALLPVNCYVNVVMNSDQVFRMSLTGLKLEPDTDPDKEPGVNPDKDPGTNPGTDPETNPDKKPGTDPEQDKKPETDSDLDIKTLKDGTYLVKGKMIKPDMKSPSMSDNAINHDILITVKDGKYTLTINFVGMKIGDKLGYLGELQYFLSGYTKNQYGVPEGPTAKAEVLEYQKDAKGNKLKDEYGTDYPHTVRFELISEAFNDGIVPLQVFVPVMDSITPGLGKQEVYLSLDYKTLKVSEDGKMTKDPGIGDGTKDSGIKNTGKPAAGKPAAGKPAAKKPGKVKTADTAMPGTYAATLVLSLGAVYVLMTAGKRNKNK